MRKRRQPVQLVLYRTSVGIITSYSRRPTLQECIRGAGARPGSYAAEIIRRAYVWYVEDTLDLKREYARYYRLEYRTIEEFLYHKCGFGIADIGLLKVALNSGRYAGLATGSVRYQGTVTGFISCEGKDERAAGLLGATWRTAV